MRQWIKTHPLAVYIILANGITWLCWIPTLVIAQNRGYALPAAPNYATLAQGGFQDAGHIAVAVVFSLAVYGPLIAALIALLLETGKTGIIDLLRRMVKWQVHAKWYLIIVAINVTLLVVPVAIGVLTGMMDWNSIKFASIPFLAIVFLVQIVTSGLEEPGWRGYLLPRLQARFGSDKAIWLTGLIWAIWHYPFTIYDTLSKTTDMPAAALAITLLSSLAGQTMSLIGMTYIYAWIINHTKSVLIAIVFHALNNVAPLVLLGGMNPTMGIIMALVPWLVVFILERLLGKEQFPGNSVVEG